MAKHISFPLGLTSPLTAGKLVREAQIALSHNDFGDFDPGPTDGVFGPQTARATRRAKFWLGWEENNLNDHYGLALHSQLTGQARLTYGQNKRREARKEAKRLTPKRERALEEAMRHLGVKESPPESNKVLFSDWYGMRGPWCAMFVTYCYVKSGSKAFERGERYAYCPYVVNDARAGRNNLAVTSQPQRGDLVLYDWNGDGVADHIGLFEQWQQPGQFTAIEGNTSPTSDSNGGEVMRRTRSRGDVVCFVHVGA